MFTLTLVLHTWVPIIISAQQGGSYQLSTQDTADIMFFFFTFVFVWDSNLVVRQGKPEDVVAALIKQLGSVSTVAFHEEVAEDNFTYCHCFIILSCVLKKKKMFSLMFKITPEELNVEKRVKDVCAQMKVKVHTCWGSTLYHRDDLPFHHMSRWPSIQFLLDILFFYTAILLGISPNLSSWFVRLPDVYTQFRKAVETQSKVRPVFPTPEQLKPLPQGLEEGAIPTAEDLQQTGELCLCTSTKLIFTYEDQWPACFIWYGCLYQEDKPMTSASVPKFSQNHSTVTNQINWYIY